MTTIQWAIAVYLIGVPVDYLASRSLGIRRWTAALVFAPLWPLYFLAALSRKATR